MISTRYRRILSQLDAIPSPTRHGSAPRLSVDQTRTLLEIVRRLFDETNQYGEPNGSERRRSRRRAYPQRIIVTPCLAFDWPRFHESEVVVAKDLCVSGLSFVRARQFEDHQLLVTLPKGSDAELPICMAAERRHQSTSRQGLYVVGIRFVQRMTLRADVPPSDSLRSQ